MTRRIIGLLGILCIYLLIHMINAYQIKNLNVEICDGLNIVTYGPSVVFKNERFNVQPTGESAIWVKLSDDSKTSYGIAYINGIPLETVVVGNLVTAVVPDRSYAKPGTYPLTIVLRLSSRMCRLPSAVFSVIEH